MEKRFRRASLKPRKLKDQPEPPQRVAPGEEWTLTQNPRPPPAALGLQVCQERVALFSFFAAETPALRKPGQMPYSAAHSPLHNLGACQKHSSSGLVSGESDSEGGPESAFGVFPCRQSPGHTDRHQVVQLCWCLKEPALNASSPSPRRPDHCGVTCQGRGVPSAVPSLPASLAAGGREAPRLDLRITKPSSQPRPLLFIPRIHSFP